MTTEPSPSSANSSGGLTVSGWGPGQYGQVASVVGLFPPFLAVRRIAAAVLGLRILLRLSGECGRRQARLRECAADFRRLQTNPETRASVSLGVSERFTGRLLPAIAFRVRPEFRALSSHLTQTCVVVSRNRSPARTGHVVACEELSDPYNSGVGMDLPRSRNVSERR